MYLVFDVGGTFVKYAWMGVDGDIHEKGKYPTPTREGESVPEFVESLGQIYDRYKDRGVEGIALSLPGLIDAENGIIRNGGGIKYLKDAHLAQLLSARCDDSETDRQRKLCGSLRRLPSWYDDYLLCHQYRRLCKIQMVELFQPADHEGQVFCFVCSWNGSAWYASFQASDSRRIERTEP